MTEQNRNMIFYLPYEADPQSHPSGSQVRPVNFLNAYKELGYNITLILGNSHARQKAIKKCKEEILAGKKFDFFYGESATTPYFLTDDHHLPLHPWFEQSFFRFLRSQHIPSGFFYRDVYWKFPEFDTTLSWPKQTYKKFFHQVELRMIRSAFDIIFVPSNRMMNYLPELTGARLIALPPGLNAKASLGSDSNQRSEKPLELFYVGGVGGNMYDLTVLFDAVSALPQKTKLNICTRKSEWDAFVPSLRSDLPDNVSIHHLSGESMQNLMKSADICLYFIPPSDYVKFCMPVKLFEYLGQHKPVIATSTTSTAEFLKEHSFGWGVDYNADALKTTLDRLFTKRQELETVTKTIEEKVSQHTWKARANFVAEQLTLGH